MRFCVMRLADVGPATTPESAWPMYQARGWVRVSEWMDDTSQVYLPDYADAPDLDAEPEPAKTPAAKTSKEK
jgi:hypothetical protein